ncbi:uncharacterized protein [Cicer arietinum]|uniref:uncharacterized protein n=1 Tax=Cicer arietinum TaxID=3827 RepID=UPI003CC5B067
MELGMTNLYRAFASSQQTPGAELFFDPKKKNCESKSKSGMVELNVYEAGLVQRMLLSKQIKDVIAVEIKKGMVALNIQHQVASVKLLKHNSCSLCGGAHKIGACETLDDNDSARSEETVTPNLVEEHTTLEKEEEPVVQKREPLSKPEIRLPFPQRLKKEETEKQFGMFLDVFKKLQINIPFAEALEQMPIKIGGETVMLTAECSAILQRKLSSKLKDPGSFSIPCAIGNRTFGKALCDLGASVSLMPLSIYKKLGIGKVKDTQLMLQFADRSMKHPYGVVEDVLVKVDKFIFPVDFVVLDMEEDNDIPLILGRPFLATGRAMIDVADGTLTFKVNEETITFNILKAMEHSNEREGCNRIEIFNSIVDEEGEHQGHIMPLERVLCLPQDVVKESKDPKVKEVLAMPEASSSYSPRFPTTWEGLKRNENEYVEKKKDTPLAELNVL